MFCDEDGRQDAATTSPLIPLRQLAPHLSLLLLLLLLLMMMM